MSIEIKNPYFVNNVDSFFDLCVDKIMVKLQTMPNLEVFTMSQVIDFLVGLVGTDTGFKNSFDLVSNSIDHTSDGFVQEIKQRLEKRLVT